VIVCVGGCLPPSLKTLNYDVGGCFASLVCNNMPCTHSTRIVISTLSLYFVNVNYIMIICFHYFFTLAI
jgi:hypothetical protein